MSDDFFSKVGSERRNGGSTGGGLATMAVAPDEDGYLAPTPASDARKPTIDGAGSWAEEGGTVFSRIGKSHGALPAGVYRCGMSNNGPFFLKVENKTDQLVQFGDSESERIVDEIRAFQGMRDKFAAHGFLHKRGVLLWGPPGSGKTTTIQQLVDLIVRGHGGIAVIIERPGIATACLQMLRAVEPGRQVVGILEDLDALVERYGESEFLALLDGESQVDNVVYVATTNYPECLDARFVDRPSRFDTIRYIGMPGPQARATYFNAKVPGLTPPEERRYVAGSEGYSVAHMRELIILTRCFGVPFDEAKARLDKARVKPESNKAPGRSTFGFS